MLDEFAKLKPIRNQRIRDSTFTWIKINNFAFIFGYNLPEFTVLAKN